MTKDELRRQALLAAYDQSREVLTGVSVMKRHPVEVGMDAALEVAWTEIERLRAVLASLEWECPGQSGMTCPGCERYEGEEHDPDCKLAAELRSQRDEALQQQADLARADWREGH